MVAQLNRGFFWHPLVVQWAAPPIPTLTMSSMRIRTAIVDLRSCCYIGSRALRGGGITNEMGTRIALFLLLHYGRIFLAPADCFIQITIICWICTRWAD
jgi:hypothetical protein